MALKIYNTLTKKTEPFRPLRKGVVTMYNCGPTVYDYAHIGNFRSYVFADLLRRYLEYSGLKVKQVMNITDVGHLTIDEEADSRGEDKIEASAKRQHKTPLEISSFYTKAFLEDVKTLNLKEPMKRPKATEHIKEMIGIIDSLVRNGHAYEVNGSVYYDISSFKRYGKLSGNPVEQLKAGARLEVNPEKKDPLDFALWVKNPKHVMQWDSPWGRGYPGWHIECSAMSMKYLGETIDVHTGGEDNIFPHHECEIAQSEGATGKRFVKYWLHVRHLMVNGKKMSKSKGNFYTLRDLLKKGYDPRAIRYLLLSAHYRTRLNFTEKGVREAETAIGKLEGFLAESCKGRDGPKTLKAIKKAKDSFRKAMDDDLNISGALATVFGFVREINKSGGGRKACEALLDFDKVLGLRLSGSESWKELSEAPAGIRSMLEMRERHRKDRDWKKADSIREQLRKKGVVLEDTKRGPRWRKVKD